REGDGPDGADTSNSGWVDTNVFNSRPTTGQFDATTFEYAGNDLTPISEWLGADAASYTGDEGNLDDGVFRMIGYVYVPEAGEQMITFNAGSDDGMVVYIADEAVVENDNGHGEGDAVSGTYDFPAEGYYPIDIRYFNGDWTNDAGDHGGANFRNNTLAELTLVQSVEGADPLFRPVPAPVDGYANDFTYDDGTTDLGDGSLIASNDGTNSVQGGALQLTEAGTNSTAAAFVLPPMDASGGWTASFDFVIEHSGENTPADGFSFNYGAIIPPDQEFGYGNPAEEGYGDATPHISFQVDTWLWNDAAGQDAGVGIEVTGAEIALTKATDDNANFMPNERVEASATLSWDPDNGASFSTTGLRTNADFSNLSTGDFAAQADYGFSIIARTGGHNETLLIDNLVVTPAGGGPAPEVELLVNGSFEDPVVDNINTNNLGVVPTGWSQTGADATWNVIRNDGTPYDNGVDTAADGSQVLDLNGIFVIFQNFTVTETSDVRFGASFANRSGHEGDPSTVGIYDATGATLLSPEVSVDTSAEPQPSEVWASGEDTVTLEPGDYQIRV
ncbi:MAG: PA14 domain-containing protein, partial [Verrucomicrobiota bacterium]